MYWLKVKKVRKFAEARTVEIEFDRDLRGYPGQFVMLNVPDFEEIPLSLSSPKTVTVKAVGETTERLLEITEGESLGIRGPFGRPFSLPRRSCKVYLVAGGIGIAPINYLYQAIKNFIKRTGIDIDITVIHGVRNEKEIVYEYPEMKVATDDGSMGFKGNAVELFLRVLSKSSNDRVGVRVYACGPRPMLKALYGVVKDYGLEAEFSLESYMRCGIGVCGSCVLGGYRVCSDGPVFGVMELEEIFGDQKSKMDGS